MPKPAKVKPKQPKPHAMAFVGDAPCSNCGSEWFRPGFITRGDEMEDATLCANLWCDAIAKLRAQRLVLAKLAADTPQFDNPLHVYDAKALRDRILAAAPHA